MVEPFDVRRLARVRRTLDALGGYSLYEYQLAFGSEGFKVFGAQISPAVLGTLGVAPALGRFLTDDDDREGAPPVVIVSDGLWRERYGASPGVLGGSLVIDGARTRLSAWRRRRSSSRIRARASGCPT